MLNESERYRVTTHGLYVLPAQAMKTEQIIDSHEVLQPVTSRLLT